MKRFPQRASAAHALLLLGAALLLANLGDRTLWYDEAQTALLGRGVLESGLPKVAANENLPTDRADASDFNRDRVFVWNTWLPFYLTAGSFALFGESEWAARIPFALVGFACFSIYWRLSRRIAPGDPKFEILALAILITSVPLLLHLRQCRYYSLVSLGTLWSIWGYLAILRHQKSGWAHLSAALLLTFHSFFAVAALNLAAIWIHALWKHRRSCFLRPIALATALLLGGALPFTAYSDLLNRPTEGPSSLLDVGGSIWIDLLWINAAVLPFAIPVVAGFFRKAVRPYALAAYAAFLLGSAVETMRMPMLALIGLLAILAAVSLRSAHSRESSDNAEASEPARALFQILAILVPLYLVGMSVASPYPFLRYLLPVSPLLMLWGATLLKLLFEEMGRATWILVFLLLGSNALSALPLRLVEMLVPSDESSREEYTVFPSELWRWTPIRSEQALFLYEISHHIADPEEGISAYLERWSAPGQVVKTSYEDLSLMFYHPELHIISRWNYGGGVPDFVIPRPPYPLNQDEAFLRSLAGVPYREEETAASDLIWSNNPDPLFHKFRIPAEKPPLKIYRRIDTTER
ncbi:MAG: glycosyltransferase family 39 protein [Deltaproteobacteria bacterium]|jgi:4-amino-4-deoxy-L-arabinose transferase-like glycosyltransferase|nr:glycosyltransferase family 39 protein [Deltaproteobacteria bacterium]MBW2541030.1 glycosyltransferase family 39 protein [Deltaproteobacteria bacterium]